MSSPTQPEEQNTTRCSAQDRLPLSQMIMPQNTNKIKQVVPSSRTFRRSSKTVPTQLGLERLAVAVAVIKDQMRMGSLAMCSRRCQWAFLVRCIYADGKHRLAPEVAHVRPWYSWLGGASGAAIGYIVANVPGAVAGGQFLPSLYRVKLIRLQDSQEIDWERSEMQKAKV
jgi:hypothetical protein